MWWLHTTTAYCLICICALKCTPFYVDAHMRKTRIEHDPPYAGCGSFSFGHKLPPSTSDNRAVAGKLRMQSERCCGCISLLRFCCCAVLQSSVVEPDRSQDIVTLGVRVCAGVWVCQFHSNRVEHMCVCSFVSMRGRVCVCLCVMRM